MKSKDQLREQRIAYYAQRVEQGLGLWEDVVVDNLPSKGKGRCMGCGSVAGYSKGLSFPGQDRAGRLLLCWSCIRKYGFPNLWKLPLQISRSRTCSSL